jgi:nicotinate-nucleotide adenylyltransferase
MNYVELIKKNLKEPRCTHSINVSEMCRELSKKHRLNEIMSQDAYTGGILHDIAKMFPRGELEETVKKSRFNPDPVEICTPSLWHAIAGAEYAADELGIVNPEIINAIRFHTIARENMGVIEKIVYIADKISIDRTYKSVEEARALAFKDLDLCVFHIIKRSMKKLINSEARIPSYTTAAYDYYNQRISNGGGL